MSDAITCPAARTVDENKVCDMEYCFCKNGGKLYKEGNSDFHKCRQLKYILEEIQLALIDI